MFLLLDNVRYPIPSSVHTWLSTIYRDLQRESSHCEHPNCEICGNCCNLSAWGHQLWLTQFELYVLIKDHGLRRSTGDGVCPYLDNGLCKARSSRALGCRVFACQATQNTVEEKYERYFSRIRMIAERNGLELYYGELLQSLETVELIS